MDILFDLVQDVIVNWDHYLELLQNVIVAFATFLGAAVAVASVIAKWTPTPKDDEFVSKFTAIVARLSVVKLKGAK